MAANSGSGSICNNPTYKESGKDCDIQDEKSVMG
jgi:hypothetical protein